MTDAPPTRAELAALYAEDNRRRAQHEIDRRQWQQAQEALAEAQERAEEPETLMYRTADNDAPEPFPAAEPEPFYEQSSTAPNFFDDIERNEEFADTLAYVLAKLRDQWRDEIADETRKLAYLIERLVVPGERAESEVYEAKRRLLNLEVRVREIGGDQTEIKAMLGRALMLFEQRSARAVPDSSVIDLPNWRRDDAA
jgi:hypothetical protein